MAQQKPLRIGTTVPIQQFEATDTIPPANIENGIPAGGSDGQVLTKTSATNYATAWETPSGGGGGVATVTGAAVNNTDPANPVVNAVPLIIPTGTYAQMETEFGQFGFKYFSGQDAILIDEDGTQGLIINSPSAASAFIISDGGAGFSTSAAGLDIGASGVKVISTTVAFYPSVMTTTQRDAMTGVTAGAQIFNTTVSKTQTYDGTTWQNHW